MKLRTGYLAILVALLTVTVAGLVWWQVERSHELMRRQVLAQAEQRSVQLADAMAGQVGGLLSSIDLALQQLRKEWGGAGRDMGRFDASARAMLGTLPTGAVTHVTVVGLDGYIVYNSLNVRQRTYVGDREHFRAHLSGADRLVIGKPVLSRLGNNWTFVVNRPILRDGRFAGTVNISVSAEYMSKTLARLQFSGKDIIGLFQADGSFMARSQDFLQAMGKSIPANRPFLVRGAPASGVYYMPGAFDQAPRIYAWRRLEEYGLITAIGLAEDTVLAPLNEGMRRDRAISVGLVAVVALFGGFIVLLLVQAVRRQSEIAASEAFRKRVFESSPIPIVVMDGETFEYIDCNPAATDIYRYASRAETLGKTPMDVSAPLQYDGTPSAETAGGYIEKALSEGSVRFEWRHQRPDGELWDAEVHLMSFRSGQRRLLQFTLQDITERRRTEGELRQFKTTLDLTQDCVFMFSPDSLRFFYANQGATEQVGYSTEELMRMTPVDIKPDHDEASFRAMVAPLQAGGNASVSFETRHRHKDGHDVPVEILLQYVAPLGEPSRFIAVVRDISERKRIQKALQESEQRYRMLTEHAPEAIVVFDADRGSFVDANENAVRLFGMPKEELLCCSPALLSPPLQPDGRDSTSAARERIGEAISGGTPVFEWVHRSAAGRDIPCEVRLLRIPAEGHNLVRGSITDITQRKQAEEAVRSSEQRYTLAAQIGRSGAWEMRPLEGKIFFDGNLTRLLGYGPHELSENLADWVDTVPEDARSGVADAIQTVIDGRSDHYTVEHPVRRKDGSIGWVQVKGQRVSPPGTTPLRLVGSTVDITEQKRAEEALKQLNEELEARVERRTAELTAAKEEAERANLAKSDFLSRMSHELRTPLNAILGFGQLLELQIREDEPADNVQEILHAGRHLLDLINEVLDLARIESGKFTVSQEAVPLRPLIAECLTLIRPLAEARGIRIDAAGQDCGGHVLADRTRLKQVLLNLLSNAVKYNRQGGSLGIACVAAGATVQIRISDSGEGLTSEQQRRLFVAFERLDADQHAIEGTGIGLALSKRLVELMDGAIGVESTPGVGSTFWVGLATADGQPDAAPEDGAAEFPDYPVGAKQWDVLCIEDNPANLRLIERILARRGDIRLLSASAPGLGLELAAAHRPVLILLDINLPDMDGYAVMQCLRESPATRDIPVVAISANAMPQDLARGKAAGFADYLTKPLDISSLLAAVDAHLADMPGKSPI